METRKSIDTTLNHHFIDILFDPRKNTRGDIRKITRLIPSLITHEKNDLLMKPITLIEVEEEVFQMKEGTSLGPYVFRLNLFHHFWDLIKMEVWTIVEDSRVSRRIFLALNATFITLIPKSEGADSLDKFRPISLCNVIYKITTKVIVNRLKPILLGLISLEQSRFVEGRQITDGIILVHKMLHSINVKKLLGMMVKLDIAKAYDKIIWHFIRSMLEDFGFRVEWVNWIMNLVSYSFFYILVNGVPSRIAKP